MSCNCNKTHLNDLYIRKDALGAMQADTKPLIKGEFLKGDMTGKTAGVIVATSAVAGIGLGYLAKSLIKPKRKK